MGRDEDGFQERLAARTSALFRMKDLALSALNWIYSPKQIGRYSKTTASSINVPEFVLETIKNQAKYDVTQQDVLTSGPCSYS
eukprot:1324817-Amphidinium_carterae.1